MASISSIFYSQVDGLGYDVDPAGTLTPNPMLLGGRSLKFAGSTSGVFSMTSDAFGRSLTLSGNLTPNGLSINNTRPTVSQTIPANYIALVFGFPLRIPSGVVITVSAGALLRIIL